jgi:desulfoferrodoxin (superoxide reductase-like protein)
MDPLPAGERATIRHGATHHFDAECLPAFFRSHTMSRFVTCMLLILTPLASYAAWEAPYIEDGVARCVAAAKKLKDMTGFEARSNGMSLIGTFQEVDGEYVLNVKLLAGKEYVFVAAGDPDVKDLDLKVVEDNKVIAEDDADDNVPVVAVTAEEDTQVKLKMTLVDAPSGESHFCVLMLLEKGGTGGKLARLEKVAKQINDAAAAIIDKGKLEFDRSPNRSCLIAGLIANGEELPFTRPFLGDTDFLVIGAADEFCKDLDLEILDGEKVIAKDEDEDATPVAKFSVKSDRRCKINVIMHESMKPSFAVVAVLTPQ